MNCQNCKSDRIVKVFGKCSDCCNVSFKTEKFSGYVPTDIGLGDDEDFIQIKFCMNCGQLQGKFPLPLSEIEQETEQKKNDPFQVGDLVEIIKTDRNGNILIGEVENYDRNCETVKVCVKYYWNSYYQKIEDRLMLKQTITYSIDEIKKTDKEF